MSTEPTITTEQLSLAKKKEDYDNGIGAIEEPFKKHNNSIDLVKEMIYLCIMGTKPSTCDPRIGTTEKHFPQYIDYRYDTAINDISKDLDTLIKEVSVYIDSSKEDYLELLKTENEDMDMFSDKKHSFFEKIRALLPILFAMHPDEYEHFELMVHY